MELYLKKLKKARLSNTKPRQAIFNLLKNNDHTPQSVNQLITDSKVFADRSTVYRTLASLEKAGIAKRVYTGWKYKIELSDDFYGHHHHITCEFCGKSQAIDHHKELEKNIQNIATELNFTPNSHSLEIQGICNNCTKNQQS